MTGTPFLFVYGTLRGDVAARPAQAREAFARLQAGGDLEGAARMEGRLYGVAWYPGMTEGAGQVRGEVWRLREPEKLLAALDVFEGADYVRERREAVLDDGRVLAAHVYRFTGDVSRAEAIGSGDFLDWAAARKTG